MTCPSPSPARLPWPLCSLMLKSANLSVRTSNGRSRGRAGRFTAVAARRASRAQTDHPGLPHESSRDPPTSVVVAQFSGRVLISSRAMSWSPEKQGCPPALQTSAGRMAQPHPLAPINHLGLPWGVHALARPRRPYARDVWEVDAALAAARALRHGVFGPPGGPFGLWLRPCRAQVPCPLESMGNHGWQPLRESSKQQPDQPTIRVRVRKPSDRSTTCGPRFSIRAGVVSSVSACITLSRSSTGIADAAAGIPRPDSCDGRRRTPTCGDGQQPPVQPPREPEPCVPAHHADTRDLPTSLLSW